MKFFGFRVKRVKEFAEALGDSVGKEGPISLLPALWAALRIFSGRTAGRSLWFKRMTACHRCPIFDHRSKRCLRVWGSKKVGCGCYMPFKAVDQGSDCWARENKIPEIGWSDSIR